MFFFQKRGVYNSSGSYFEIPCSLNLELFCCFEDIVKAPRKKNIAQIVFGLIENILKKVFRMCHKRGGFSTCLAAILKTLVA